MRCTRDKRCTCTPNLCVFLKKKLCNGPPGEDKNIQLPLKIGFKEAKPIKLALEEVDRLEPEPDHTPDPMPEEVDYGSTMFITCGHCGSQKVTATLDEETQTVTYHCLNCKLTKTIDRSFDP